MKYRMRLLYKSEPIKFAPAAEKSVYDLISSGNLSLLTSTACTNGVTSGTMHARGCAVVVRYCIEAHVLGVGDTSLELCHDVVYSLLEESPCCCKICSRRRHGMRNIGRCDWC